MNNVNEWKWSLGEAYYKSARAKKTIGEPNSDSTVEPDLDTESYDSSRNAIKQSLAEDTDIFSTYDLNDTMNDTMNDTNMMSITNSIFSRSQSESGTRREELDDKMSGRDPTLQRGTNPFMGQTSYVNDVVTRDMFLKPVNTTQGEKKKNKSEEQSFEQNFE